MPPLKLTCVSDGSELEFTQTIKTKTKTKTDIVHEYRYTKSYTKKGSLITFSEAVLDKFLKNKVFI